MPGRPPSVRPGDTWPGSRLRAVEDVGTDGRGARVWRCLCDPALGGCGGTVDAPADRLRGGNTRSCGCLAVELAEARRADQTDHEQRAEVLRLVGEGLSRRAAGARLGIHPSRVTQLLRKEGVPAARPEPAVAVGREFGRLRVLAEAGRRGRQRLWRCLCDPRLGGCGSETAATTGALRDVARKRKGGKRSCGCLLAESRRRGEYRSGRND